MSTIETAATSTIRRWISSRSRNDRAVRRPRRSLRMTAVLAIGRSILPVRSKWISDPRSYRTAGRRACAVLLDRCVVQRWDERPLDLRAEHVVDERLGQAARRALGVHVAVGAQLVRAVRDVRRCRIDAVELERRRPRPCSTGSRRGRCSWSSRASSRRPWRRCRSSPPSGSRWSPHPCRRARPS